MSQIGIVPIYRATDSNGNPLANARLYTFETGTTTPAAVYTTPALNVSHGAYVQADSGGLFPAFYPDPTITYRFQVRISPYSSAVSGLDFDPVTAADVGLRVDITGTGGAALVGTAAGGTVQDVIDSLAIETAFTFAEGDLWDNGYWIAQTGYHQHSPQARAVFQTEATSVDIGVFAAGFTPSGTDAAVQVYVNGNLHATSLLAATTGAQTLTEALPAGRKTVAIVAGVQAFLAGDTLGVFLTGATFNEIATMLPPNSLSTVVAYGDSTSQGGGGGTSGVNLVTAWPTRFREISARSLTVEAGSGRAFFDDAGDGTKRTAFVATIVAMNPAYIWMAIGTNDWRGNLWTAANFGTAYGLVIDALHTALPNARIFCATPIMFNDPVAGEAANGLGDNAEKYRQAIRDLWPTRSTWMTLIEGPAILGADDLKLEDGIYIHPNDEGNRKYAQFVEAALNGAILSEPRAQDPGVTEDVVWDTGSDANVTISGNDLSKSAGVDGDPDAGATSTRSIKEGDRWWVRMTVTETNKSRLLGVSSVAAGIATADVLYGVAPQSTATLAMWQSGTGYSSGLSPMVAGDILQIRAEGQQVYFERIRKGRVTTLRKASRLLVAADYPLFVKANIINSSGTITDAQMHGVIG